MAPARKPESFTSYVSGFPPSVRTILRKVRAAIKETVPQTREAISYGIPTFTLNNTYLIYLAGYKKHFSLDPIPRGDAMLRREIVRYVAGAGTLRFSLDEPVPFGLIKKIVRELRRQNKARAVAMGRRK